MQKRGFFLVNVKVTISECTTFLKALPTYRKNMVQIITMIVAWYCGYQIGINDNSIQISTMFVVHRRQNSSI